MLAKLLTDKDIDRQRREMEFRFNVFFDAPKNQKYRALINNGTYCYQAKGRKSNGLDER